MAIWHSKFWSALTTIWHRPRSGTKCTMRWARASRASCRRLGATMPTLTDPAYVRQSKAYLQLRQHWRRDPVRYVEQRFGATPTVQQVQILQAVAPPGAHVSVRSGHGIGKSSGAAWVICWFVETHDFGKVPCTAP